VHLLHFPLEGGVVPGVGGVGPGEFLELCDVGDDLERVQHDAEMVGLAGRAGRRGDVCEAERPELDAGGKFVAKVGERGVPALRVFVVADPLEAEVGLERQFGTAHAGAFLDEVGDRGRDRNVEREPFGSGARHHGVEIFACVHLLRCAAIAAMWAGVLPQQPPTTRAPAARKRAAAAAKSAGKVA